MIKKLNVMLWGEKVGTLISAPHKYTHQICFYFDPEFTKSGIDIAPLRAPIAGVVAQNGLPIYPEKGREFGGLPSFIADSMPDRWGHMVFDEWAKSRRVAAKDLSPLDRLAYIGSRGMGALEFMPPISEDMSIPFRVEISELSKLAQQVMSEAKNFRASLSPDLMIERLFRVGTSAGGRSPKAVVNVNRLTGECLSGQVAPPHPDFVPMIIKFDEHTDIPSTRIEYSYYLMAREAGLNMMPSMLTGGSGETHFLTQRFDRKGEEKVHIQTLAAINPLSSSYEDLFDAAQKIGIFPLEMRQLWLLMTMNVICGNVDDHNKNFSFMLEKGGSWHLAPAYDFTFTVDPSAPFYVNRHSLTVNGKNQDITAEDLFEIANQYNIKGATSMFERVVTVAKNYRKFGMEAGVDDFWCHKIESEILRRLENSIC